jgi:DNA-binding CsgD family transcriptional regulator
LLGNRCKKRLTYLLKSFLSRALLGGSRMGGKRRQVRQAVELFAQAPLDASRWMAALEVLASATDSGRAQIIGIGGLSGAAFNKITGHSEEMVDTCARIDGYGDRVNYRVAVGRRSTEMVVLDDRDYAAAMPLLSDDRYVQYCEEIDIPFGCQTALIMDRSVMIGLALLRSRKDGTTTAQQRAVFEAIAPHARAAARTQIALKQEGHALLRGAFDSVSSKTLTIDAFGRVGATTPAADKLLSSSNRLRIVDGFLESCIGIETRRIGLTLARILSGNLIDGDALVLPAIPGVSGELHLAIRSLPKMDWDLGHAPRAIIILQAAEPLSIEQIAVAIRRYGLTNAEADVARAMTGGMTRGQIAEDRQVSVDTVKTQLKSIFLKTGVRREADLVGLLRQLR